MLFTRVYLLIGEGVVRPWCYNGPGGGFVAHRLSSYGQSSYSDWALPGDQADPKVGLNKGTADKIGAVVFGCGRTFVGG